jgi:hypothetical protein
MESDIEARVRQTLTQKPKTPGTPMTEHRNDEDGVGEIEGVGGFGIGVVYCQKVL